MIIDVNLIPLLTIFLVLLWLTFKLDQIML